MQRPIIHLILIPTLALLGLFGCATRKVTTTGVMRSPSPLASVKIALDPIVPSQIELTKSGHGYGLQITSSDKAAAVSQANALNLMFKKGFLKQFSVEAAKHGLVVTNSTAAVSTMKVSITSVEMRCLDGSCMSELHVSIDVIDTAGVPVWNFFASVGPPTVYSSVSDDIFASFAGTLLATMKRDRVIDR